MIGRSIDWCTQWVNFSTISQLSETIACISTRITAAIQIKPDGCHQVDSERINELFAVSLPELTLAWLNL